MKPKIDNKEIEENLGLNTLHIYEVISREGKEELRRPASSLVFSGIIAGVCISFSLFVMGYLSILAPDNKALIAAGYCVGFLMVSRGRLQLFTENTITVILPLLANFNYRNLIKIARLWGLVFIANMIGTFFCALLVSKGGLSSVEHIDAFVTISMAALDKTSWEIFATAIPAGFILASMVWMLPNAEGAKLWITLIMTYIISIGHFSHVVAGSTEAFLLLLEGHIDLAHCLTYIGFAAIGNIMGGTILFSMFAYAQTYKEM